VCCSALQCEHTHGTRDNAIPFLVLCCSVLQCVAVCCSVLQCVAVWTYTRHTRQCHSLPRVVLQCVAVCCGAFAILFQSRSYNNCVAMCCSVLQCVAVCCSVLQWCKRTNTVHSPFSSRAGAMTIALQCVAVCCSVLQCVAVCCSVLQCVAVWCSHVRGRILCIRHSLLEPELWLFALKLPPKIHQDRRTQISRYLALQIRIKILSNLNGYRGIWLSGFGGFRK